MRNVAKMAGGRLATQAVLVVSAFAIPRVLGAEHYGLFAALMAMLAIVQTASALGLPLVEVRFLAPAWTRGPRDGALALASTIWLTRLGLALLGGGALALWIAHSPQLGLSPGLAAWVVALALVRFAFEGTKSLLLPLGRVGRLAAFDFARAALTLPLVIGLFPFLGLEGVFAGLSALQTALLGLGAAGLLGLAPVGPSRFRWPALRPHVPFAAAAAVGAASGMFQAQFAIYAVANWVTRQEAAYLGVAVQIYSLVQVLFITSRRSLMPVLSELQVAGEARRLAYWGGIMLRYAAASLSAVAVGFALLGEGLIRWLLTDDFAPAFPCAAVILVAALGFCCAASCNGLCYVRGRAWLASANSVLYAALTGAGLVWALAGPDAGVSLRIAWAYAGAAAAFFASAYLSLGLSGGIWLPLPRALLLMAPALLAWPAALWEASGPARLAAALVFLAGYAALALSLRLLPREELRTIARHLR